MQVSVEATTGLERRMTVAVDEERIASVVNSRLKDLTHSVKLKGFRKGKVPLKVVEQQYGKQVRQEVVGEVLQSTFYEAVSQEKLRPAGMPAFDAAESEPGKGLEYIATFEIYPEVSLAPLSGKTIAKPVSEVTDADLNTMMDTIRKQHMGWESVDRAAQDGDQVNIDFNGSIDGVAFEGGEGKGIDLELGSGRMIKGFEAGLNGAKAGDDVTLDVTFPEEYHAEALAGKPAQFATHVNKVEAPVLPEVDAELAKKLGVDDGDIEKLHTEIRGNMQREMESRLKSKEKEAVMEVLLEANKLDIPQALVETESEALRNQMMQNLASQGLAQKDLGALGTEMFKEQAERRVALGLIMSEIVKQNDLKVDADKVKAKVNEIAAPYEHPDEVVKWYYGDKQRLAEVESLVFEEQVVDWVMGQGKVKDTQVSFDELMAPEAGK